MTTTTSANVPDDVLRTIVEKRRAAQAAKQADEVTLDKVKAALDAQDWGLLNEMFQRDDNLIVAYSKPTEEEFASNSDRVAKLHLDITTRVRDVLSTDGMSLPLKSFVGTFFNKSGVYPADVDLVLDPRFEADGTSLYMSFPKLQDHDLAQLQATFRSAIEELWHVSLADRVAKEAIREMGSSREGKIIGLTALWECFDDVIASGSDHLSLDVLLGCERYLNVSVSKEQFHNMIKKGMNATAHYVVNNEMYVPTIEDFYVALAHVDDLIERPTSVESTINGVTVGTGDNIAKRIAKVIAVDMEDDEFLAALTVFEQGNRTFREAEATAELINCRDATGNQFAEERLLATQNDNIISSGIHRGYIARSEDLVEGFIREGFVISLWALSGKNVLVTDAQMDRILDLGEPLSGGLWKNVIRDQVESGYIPQSVAVLERLYSLDKQLLTKIEANIAKAGVDLGR
jgi:hypothetical protein